MLHLNVCKVDLVQLIFRQLELAVLLLLKLVLPDEPRLERVGVLECRLVVVGLVVEEAGYRDFEEGLARALTASG